MRSFLLILLAIFLATLPAWLPHRVYLPPSALNPSSPTAATVNQTQLAADMLRHGKPPLWDSGTARPLLEQGAVGVFAPTILPHLLRKSTWTWSLSTAIRLLLAATGTWLFSRLLQLRPPHRLTAALLYTLIAFHVSSLDESLLNLTAWLPWSLFAAQRLIHRTTLRRILLSSFLFAGPALLGDLPAALCILAACAGLIFFNLAWFRPRATALAIFPILLAILLGIGLAGVQWIPLLGYMLQSSGSHAPRVAPTATLALMWSIPILLILSLLLAIANAPRARLVPWIAVALLIVAADIRYRGVSSNDFCSTSHPSFVATTQPVVWVAGQSKWLPHRDEAAAHAATLPAKLVVLDEELDPTRTEWLSRSFPDRHDTAAKRSFWSTLPKIEWIDQSGNQIHLRAKTGGDGWAIIPLSFASGWTARIFPAAPFGSWKFGSDEIVLRAFGKWLVVPVSLSVPGEIVLNYRPPSFRRGLLLTAATAVILLLMAGLSIGRVRAGPPPV
jgi:hypothetical protein